MIQKILPKFKRGQAVSFPGANHLIALKKTFVYAVATEDEINYYYLIEHPNGILLTEKNEAEFKGYDVRKLTKGLRYVVAGETELQAVETPQAEVTSEPAPPAEQQEEKEYTLVFTEGKLDAIAGAMANMSLILPAQKSMIMAQTGMTEQAFNNLLSNTKAVAEDLRALGFDF